MKLEYEYITFPLKHNSKAKPPVSKLASLLSSRIQCNPSPEVLNHLLTCLRTQNTAEWLAISAHWETLRISLIVRTCAIIGGQRDRIGSAHLPQLHSPAHSAAATWLFFPSSPPERIHPPYGEYRYFHLNNGIISFSTSVQYSYNAKKELQSLKNQQTLTWEILEILWKEYFKTK